MFTKTEMDLLAEVLVKREMATGASETDAKCFALGYLVSFVQKNLIDRSSEGRRQLIRAEVLERVSIVTGDL